MEESKIIRCSRCIMPSSYPTISYDEKGECNFCNVWNERWGNIDFDRRSDALDKLLDSFRGKTKPYDCIIGLSGGKDSCYATYFMKKKGMSPLTVTFVNGFLSDVAMSNINSIIEALSLPHILVKPDWELMKKWYRHFLLTAGEFCSACSFGIRAALYRVAKSYGIKLMVAGTSPRTEANSPKEFFTASDGYFRNVAKIAFSEEEMSGFRYLNQTQRVVWHAFKTPLYLQLPNYIPWKEEEMLKEMKENLNWEGLLWEQHADCTMNDAKDFLKFSKFGVTEKAAKLSSLIRDKQISREKALEFIEKYESELMRKEKDVRDKFKKYFDVSEEQIDKALKLTHTQFIPGTYDVFLKLKKTFYK